MEKVKVTKEQAKGLNQITTPQSAVKEHVGNWQMGNRLNDLTLDELIRALYIGYEVEPEFHLGDWVVLEDGYIGEIEFINEVEGWANIGYSKDTKERGVCLAKTYDLIDIKRHATPGEIAEEKERRKWAKLGREVNEYKKGDIVSTGSITRVINYVWDNGEVGLQQMDYSYKPHEIFMVCPAENRLDLEGGE